jgi:formate hydrogenlyase subunit 3/multisubunit Na+/H+ antiporter MnhD subunit
MKVLRYLGAYGSWFVLIGLGILVFVMARTVFLDFLAIRYGEAYSEFESRVDFLNKIFSIFIGLIWLVFAIVSEDNLRKSVTRGGLLKQFSHYLGPELLILFGLDLLLIVILGGIGGGWLRSIVMIIELGLGILFTFLGWSKRSPLPGRSRKPIPVQSRIV